jgi:alpha-amylase
MKLTIAAILAATLAGSNAKTTEEWKKRSVYQLLTDRFYKTDGNLSKCTNLS